MFDLASFIQAAGYAGVTGIVFAESGLLIGFFLPGDSLLFTAGFLASQGYFDVTVMCILAFLAAVVGDSVGYSIGYRLGPKVFKREDSILFHRDHVARTQAFYEAHGGKAIILARFLPVVRTFAPVMAGVGRMKYSTFLAYNVIGGLLWAVGLTLLGYFLGRSIPNIDRYLLPIIILIIVISVAPTLFHILKDRETRERLIAMVRKWVQK